MKQLIYTKISNITRKTIKTIQNVLIRFNLIFFFS